MSNTSIRTILQSVLQLGNRLVWCEVTARGNEYEVHVVPQWNMSLAVVEAFVKGADAIRRHAELSWRLREAGWQPVHEIDSLPATAA